MDRREFIAAAVAAGAGVLGTAGAKAADTPTGKFKLNYAPSFGLFKEHAGKDPIDNIKFAADQGFTAMFDNNLPKKSEALQETIAKEMDHHKMLMGPFVAYADFKVKSFVTRDPEIRAMLKGKMEMAVEVAKRTNSKWTLVVPGRYDDALEWDYQTANVIDNLKYCAEICEKSGLVIVLEPLNALTNHPGLFLTKIPQAYMICKAVNSPSCKIVNDIYHQQITEGNLIPNIDMAWEQIGAFHVGDNPGRKEPGTGEINYKNIFKHLHEKKYQGAICMEHGKSINGKQGEVAVIEAYRQCDNF